MKRFGFPVIAILLCLCTVVCLGQTVTGAIRGTITDPSGAIVEVTKKVYGFAHYQSIPDTLQDKFSNEPLLPGFLTTPFYIILGYVLILLGVALLLGIRTREALFGMGLLYSILTIGLILVGQEQGVAWLGIHVLIVTAALALAPYNRWTVTRT